MISGANLMSCVSLFAVLTLLLLLWEGLDLAEITLRQQFSGSFLKTIEDYWR